MCDHNYSSRFHSRNQIIRNWAYRYTVDLIIRRCWPWFRVYRTFQLHSRPQTESKTSEQQRPDREWDMHVKESKNKGSANHELGTVKPEAWKKTVQHGLQLPLDVRDTKSLIKRTTETLETPPYQPLLAPHRQFFLSVQLKTRLSH